MLRRSPRDPQGRHLRRLRSRPDPRRAHGWKAEEVAKIVIAYEPIWAIGTGETASAEDAQEVCGAIRAALAEDFGAETAESTRILYGGSAKPGNIKELMAQPDVDGGLVGGASLKADSFAAMANFYA